MLKRFIIILMILTTVLLAGCNRDGNSDKHGSNVAPGSAPGSSTATKPSATPGSSSSEPSSGSSSMPASSIQPTEKPDPVKEQVDRMTLDEKLGQLLIFGFDGKTLDDKARSVISLYKPGGLILFGDNVEDTDQLLSLVNSIKGACRENGVPPFISVDEEGGRVSRMPPGFRKLPSNLDIGKAGNEELSFRIGSTLAEEVSAFGYNMDFAPVLDIFSNPENTVIGDRSFGTEPDIVKRLGVQTMKGIRAGGVIPVVKHFPGHGDTVVDSHIGLPVVEYDMERLKSFELVPFSEAIKNGAEAVMIAHILLPKLDPANPASLSKAVITDLLRNQMGFDGVVITDDLTMGQSLKTMA